jgi:hypothetical protein
MSLAALIWASINEAQTGHSLQWASTRKRKELLAPLDAIEEKNSSSSDFVMCVPFNIILQKKQLIREIDSLTGP